MVRGDLHNNDFMGDIYENFEILFGKSLKSQGKSESVGFCSNIFAGKI